MGRRAAHELTQFPENFFEWSKAFGDDLGFEATRDGRPVAYMPGTSEKVATIVERLCRGQRLWHPGDAVDDALEREFDFDTYHLAGDRKFGAVVGKDRSGRRHRYAIWTDIKGKESGHKILYVTATCGFVDSFLPVGGKVPGDEQLNRIYRHAQRHGASLVAHSSLYSARVSDFAALRDVEYPVTSIGLLWLRWMAKYVDKVVVCWGEAERLGRNLDVLWMLSRTAAQKHLYVAGEADLEIPPEVEVLAPLERFDYGPLIASREEEERELESDG